MTVAGAGALRRSMAAHRWRIAVAAALFAGHQAGEALVPVLIGVTIDQAVSTGEPGRLMFWLAVLVADFAVLSLSWRFGMRVGLLAGVRADRALRLAVTSRCLDPRGTSRTDLLPGALVSVATADVRRTTMVNFQLPHLVAAVAGGSVAGVALLVLSLPLGLLILLGTPPLLLLVRWLSGPLERRAAAQQEQAARAAGVAVDLVRGVRVLKGIGAERAGLARYRKVSRESLAATLLTTRAEAGYSGAVAAINGLFLVMVALIGGHLAASGHITVGQLVSAVGLAQFLQGPLTTFGEVTAALAAGRASAARIDGVLDAPPAIIGGDRSPTEPVTGRITISDELVIEPGRLTCLVTTDPGEAADLTRLLGGDVDEDRILLDGVAFTELAPQALRRAVLVAPHEASLFEGTIADNIGTGDLSAALRASRSDQVADSLPGGLAAPVSERGRSLSGGQRQRVALARALHADPPVLVLHEPTNAVDTVTEAEIAAALRELRAGRTTVIFTTSPALLSAADRVHLLDRGRVIASGTHASLMNDPAYRELVLG